MLLRTAWILATVIGGCDLTPPPRASTSPEKLRAEIRGLRARADALDRRLARQGERAETVALTARQRLARFKLPLKPTKAEVETYVDAVLATRNDSGSCSGDDPQVRKLTRVGPDHLDVLLERTSELGYC